MSEAMTNNTMIEETKRRAASSTTMDGSSTTLGFHHRRKSLKLFVLWIWGCHTSGGTKSTQLEEATKEPFYKLTL